MLGTSIDFDLCLQTLLLIQIISANIFLPTVELFVLLRVCLPLISSANCFQTPLGFFHLVYFIACFFLQIFHPNERTRTKIIFLDVK